MTTIHEIPNELLVKIFSYNDTLGLNSLVCKRWFEVTKTFFNKTEIHLLVSKWIMLGEITLIETIADKLEFHYLYSLAAVLTNNTPLFEKFKTALLIDYKEDKSFYLTDDQVAILNWKSSGLPFDDKLALLIQAAAISENIDVLDWLFKQQTIFLEHMFFNAAEAGKEDSIRWLINAGKANGIKVSYSYTLYDSVCKGCSEEFQKWLRSVRHPLYGGKWWNPPIGSGVPTDWGCPIGQKGPKGPFG